jgi:predicted site-specific integrase-resolvase
MDRVTELDWLTVNGAGRILEIADNTVRDWHRRGKLREIRTQSGIRLFHRDEVERLAAEKARRSDDAKQALSA